MRLALPLGIPLLMLIFLSRWFHLHKNVLLAEDFMMETASTRRDSLRTKKAPTLIPPQQIRQTSTTLLARFSPSNCNRNIFLEHGPINVANKTHFAHADGTHHFSTGTTCYAWVHQNESWLRQRTIQTLQQSPFNKMRMLIFPKWYVYNHGEPRRYPFEGTPPNHWNFDVFNPAFFQQFDEAIQQLQDVNVIAELILFHPYDGGHWGFDDMGKDNDQRYLRYVVSRFSSYSNVWWSMANEWNFVKTRPVEQWDELFQILQSEDPFGRERSIHQGGTVYYNQSQPWITHYSIQGKYPLRDQAAYVRAAYPPAKPFVWDEVQYEGDLPEGWAELDGQNMTMRFWLGAAMGAYVGHSEAFLGRGDIMDNNQLLWWSKGGYLHGWSAERIQFFRTFWETHIPSFWSFSPWVISNTSAILGVQDATKTHMLLYWDSWNLPSQFSNAVDINLNTPSKFLQIDFWNMTQVDMGTHPTGKVTFTAPARPFILQVSPAEMTT
eukprot:m.173646 g.173646  ORF g.173646 m.173646 type:complete len:493 (+) comp25254_c0_seq2:117-1595(+)